MSEQLLEDRIAAGTGAADDHSVQSGFAGPAPVAQEASAEESMGHGYAPIAAEARFAEPADLPALPFFAVRSQLPF